MQPHPKKYINSVVYLSVYKQTTRTDLNLLRRVIIMEAGSGAVSLRFGMRRPSDQTLNIPSEFG